MIDNHTIVKVDDYFLTRLDLIDCPYNDLRPYIVIVDYKIQTSQNNSVIQKANKRLRKYIRLEMLTRPEEDKVAISRSNLDKVLDELQVSTKRLLANTIRHAERLLESSNRYDDEDVDDDYYDDDTYTLSRSEIIKKCLMNKLSALYEEAFVACIIDGVILNANNTQLVQWSSIVHCATGEESTIYFVYIDQLAHPNSVLYDAADGKRGYRLDLYSKIIRTEGYLSTLSQLDDSMCKLRVIDQNITLRPYVNYKRVYLYASTTMPADVIARFDRLLPLLSPLLLPLHIPDLRDLTDFSPELGYPLGGKGTDGCSTDYTESEGNDSSNVVIAYALCDSDSDDCEFTAVRGEIM